MIAIVSALQCLNTIIPMAHERVCTSSKICNIYASLIAQPNTYTSRALEIEYAQSVPYMSVN